MPSKKPADLAETLDKAFLAACSDLKPKGKLPKGMDDAKALRAIMAKAVLELVRVRELMEEEDEEEDEPGAWVDDAGPAIPADIPTGTMTPDALAGLVEAQDQQFAVRLLEEQAENPDESAAELVTRARAPRLVKAEPIAAGEGSTE